MHQSVLDTFPKRFTEPLEGRVPCLYVDVLGLVTTAAGCLADPVTLAMPMPWKHTDGRPANRDEISAAWNGVKSDRERLKKLHWRFAAALNDLRLDDEGLDAVVRGRMLQFETELRKWFPLWDSFPADAQLATMSMSWALGPAFAQEFGNYRAAANKQDWAAARAAAGIRTDGNPGVAPRNAQNALCLTNAAASVAAGLPAETLFWPGTVPDAHWRDEELRRDAEQALAKWADRERDEPPSVAADLAEAKTDPSELAPESEGTPNT